MQKKRRRGDEERGIEEKRGKERGKKKESSNGKSSIVYYRTLLFTFFFFVFLNAKSLSSLCAALRYCQFLKSTNSLRFANLIFGNNYVRLASLDSQVNVNFLRFDI